MDRRAFLVRSGMAAVGLRFAARAQGTAAVTVHTASGTLRGESVGGINIFRGVPFAQPPVGPLRFRATQPMPPWSGVREATAFSAAPIQPGEANVAQSEDCLYLNVWTPQVGSSSRPLPVFVWIHGGGFTGGRSFDPLSDGTVFAQQGVVCVTVAYRLGVFGFLDLGPLLGEEYAGGANNAMRDLIMALRWVQNNIAAFGGDPRLVTIGGESAGAKLTDMLMGVPSAAGLFQQMVSESGGAERVWPAARAAEIAQEYATEWTAGSGLPPVRLKDAPAHEILAAQERFTRNATVHFPLRAEIDGSLMTKPPLEAIRQGSARGKRLLLGTNRDESALFLGPHPAKDPGAQDLGNLAVPQFRRVEEEYARIYPKMNPELRRIRSLTAEEYWIPSLRVADAHVHAGGTAFVYRFDFAEAAGRFAGLAFHSSELRFVWERTTTASSETSALAVKMHDAWCAFLRGEAPRANGLPPWPAYTTATRPTMLLDIDSHVENLPQEAEFRAWDGLLT